MRAGARSSRTLEFEHKYTSGVIAWAPEDQPSDQDIDLVLDEFEQTAWAGPPLDRYAWGGGATWRRGRASTSRRRGTAPTSRRRSCGRGSRTRPIPGTRSGTTCCGASSAARCRTGPAWWRGRRRGEGSRGRDWSQILRSPGDLVYTTSSAFLALAHPKPAHMQQNQRAEAQIAPNDHPNARARATAHHQMTPDGTQTSQCTRANTRGLLIADGSGDPVPRAPRPPSETVGAFA